jgi:hypothetical protein
MILVMSILALMQIYSLSQQIEEKRKMATGKERSNNNSLVRIA